MKTKQTKRFKNEGNEGDLRSDDQRQGLQGMDI